MPNLPHAISLAVFSLIPLLFLCRDKAWKDLPWTDRCVAATLACWSIAVCFSKHIGIQFFTAFALTAVAYAWHYKYFRVPARYFYFFLLYFLWHVVSLLWAPDTAAGLRVLPCYLLLVLIPLSFCCIRLERNTLHAILKAFFYTMCLYVTCCLCCWVYQSLLHQIPFVDWFHISKQTFDDIASFDLLYAWSNYHHPTYNGISLLLGFAIGLRGPFRHSLKFAYGLGSLLVILISQSRISFILWTVMLFFYWFWKLRHITPWNYIYSSVLTVLAGVFLLFGHSIVQDFLYDPIRQQNAATAWYCIQQHPWLGSGLEGIRMEMDSDTIAQAVGYRKANRGLANPHYQFLGDWMQTGIPGMAISLTLVVLCCVYAAKNRRGLLQYFLLIMILIMHIEMPLYLYKGILYFTLFTGMLSVVDGKAPSTTSGSADTNR
ncbi:MAG: O-antigen ligase family protein [Paludibacteraceae bacterium]|nr:O-antigen ligase family protein [Paludibacteraceae bacterium]